MAHMEEIKKAVQEPFKDSLAIWYFPTTWGPEYRPQNTIILCIGNPRMISLILGNPKP